MGSARGAGKGYRSLGSEDDLVFMTEDVAEKGGLKKKNRRK